jgi:phosphoglycolate phosphatase
VPQRFDLLAFDWDGTLFDSTAIIARCIQLAVGDVGGQVPSTEQARFVIGLGLAQALAHAAPDVPAHRHGELGARYRHHYVAHQDDLSLFDGVLPLLAELKARGHKLAVATGKSRRGLDDVLRRVELRAVFDATRTADETAGKPHPRMLLELMSELGVAAERTLMIGDTSHDLQLAINAGCKSVAVSYGAHDDDQLRRCQPLALVHSVVELGQWLREHA